MSDETDAKKILTTAALKNSALYYVDEDYPAGPEIQKPLRERTNRHGSESSTLETDVYVWCYALQVVHVRKEQQQEEELVGDRWRHVAPNGQGHDPQMFEA